MPIQTDGEILDDACHEVTVEILPKQLEVIGA
jgi:diacylglycerol kinase family enzyme